MGRRFNNLDAGLRYLRPVGSDPDAIVPDAPTGTALRKYQEYKAGKVNIDYPRAAGSLPGELNIIVLKPFGLPAADTGNYRTSISNRSAGQYSTFGLTALELGIDTTLQDTDKDAAGYIPAKAICRNITGTTASSKTSKVTGLPYKSKTNASYTFPVGRTTGNPSWSEQKAVIIAAVSAATGNKSVTFKPERF